MEGILQEEEQCGIGDRSFPQTSATVVGLSEIVEEVTGGCGESIESKTPHPDCNE